MDSAPGHGYPLDPEVSVCKALGIRLVSSQSKFDRLDWGCSSAIEHLPSICEILGFSPQHEVSGIELATFTSLEKNHVLMYS